MRDHTSLHAWQEARATSIVVIRLCRSSWKRYAAALFNQLQRASLSVQLNIAEGYTFGESPTFTRHLGIAYGSAVETGELLRLAIDAEIVDVELMKALLKRARRTERHRLPFTVHAFWPRPLLFASTSTLSCPHAALMSSPRLRRTTASTPWFRSLSLNPRIRALAVGVRSGAPPGWSGRMFTSAPARRASFPS